MKQEVADPLRSVRRERNEATENEVYGLFRDESVPIEERATFGLNMVTEKIAQDVEEQFSHVCLLKDEPGHSSSYADQELCRLLRMLEKRKAMMSKLEQALDEAGRLVIEN